MKLMANPPTQVFQTLWMGSITP